VQVHGGMGFIEETGAAQHLRDARIAPIYEGTNGIQAKLVTARFYAEVILPPALAQLGPLKAAGRTVFVLAEEQF
jgi:hypothetical protein